MNDGIDLRMVCDGAPPDMSPALERLAHSFLPPPTTLEVPGKRPKKVKGWTDPAIRAALQSEDALELKGEGIHVTFFRRHSGVSLGVLFRLGRTAEEIRALFLDLVPLFRPTYARVRLINRGREIHAKHYARASRTFHADGLWWLNFFGPEEEARQGGRPLALNPHARAERIADGLLLEVGFSPEEEATPEGEARVVAATRAMPPLPAQEPDRPSGEPDGIEGEPRTIDGMRGFFDGSTGRFWVPRANPPGSRIDPRTVEKLAGLQGRDGVRDVAVIFSHEETARENAPALSAVGVRAWYISTETGTPREV